MLHIKLDFSGLSPLTWELSSRFEQSLLRNQSSTMKDLFAHTCFGILTRTATDLALHVTEEKFLFLPARPNHTYFLSFAISTSHDLFLSPTQIQNIQNISLSKSVYSLSLGKAYVFLFSHFSYQYTVLKIRKLINYPITTDNSTGPFKHTYSPIYKSDYLHWVLLIFLSLSSFHPAPYPGTLPQFSILPIGLFSQIYKINKISVKDLY